jgi:hypothetical protein
MRPKIIQLAHFDALHSSETKSCIIDIDRQLFVSPPPTDREWARLINAAACQFVELAVERQPK